MENKRKALGKGLEQLFNNEAIDLEAMEENIIAQASEKDIIEVNLNDLRSNPYQPRKHFDEDALKEMAESIKEFGVFQPIIIKKSIKGYDIIAGERRCRASVLAGKKTIPAIVKDFSDAEMMEIALLENIQREDLSAIEEAEAYKNIITNLRITQDDLGKKIGKSRSYITNMLGLLRLPSSVQKLVLEGNLSMGHAKVLSKLEDPEKIEKLANQIIEESMNVRKLEFIVSESGFKKVSPIKINRVRPYDSIERTMREKIGTMVKITDRKIEIPFDSEKDLERILDILKIKIDSE